MHGNVAKFAPAAIGASTLLSWFTVPFVGSVAGYNCDSGLLLLALSAVATTFAVKGKHLFSAACSAAAAAWMVVYVVYLANQAENNELFGSIGPLDFAGFGFWAAVVIPFLVAGLSVVAHRKSSQPLHISEGVDPAPLHV
jgi:hypothetical protein